MSKKKKPEPPEVYFNDDLGRPATTCCDGIPILYRNGNASCGSCKRYFPALGAWEKWPHYQSRSAADIAAGKFNGQPRGGELPIPRGGTASRKALRPLAGQKDLPLEGATP